MVLVRHLCRVKGCYEWALAGRVLCETHLMRRWKIWRQWREGLIDWGEMKLRLKMEVPLK